MCHGTKVLERWYAGTRMFALPHTFGPIKLLAYLVEALWFPGQTFSNGQFSCRIAPLCLLGLEVRTGRWSAVWAWIVVATLFQTCFRPVSDPRKSMHGAGVSACALGSCPQKPPNGLDAVEDMGAGWCVSTPIQTHGTRTAPRAPERQYVHVYTTQIVSETGLKATATIDVRHPRLLPRAPESQGSRKRCNKYLAPPRLGLKQVWNLRRPQAQDPTRASLPTHAMRTSNRKRQRQATQQENRATCILDRSARERPGNPKASTRWARSMMAPNHVVAHASTKSSF